MDGLSIQDEALPILERRLPALQTAFGQTDLCQRQGYSWREISWIALPCWILSRGLARQVDQMTEWGKHRVWHYPIRPVDFWHALGLTGLEMADVAATDCNSHEMDNGGMGRVSLVTYCLGRQNTSMIDTRDQDRFVGGLLRGPATEEALLNDSRWPDEDRQKLARYVDGGYIRRLDDGSFKLGVPVVSPEDDQILAPVVDDICAELASGTFERSLNAFVDRLDEHGFGHLLMQPHYLGFIGFLMMSSNLARSCMESGLLREPEGNSAMLGCWAWRRGRLMKSWRKGR